MSGRRFLAVSGGQGCLPQGEMFMGNRRWLQGMQHKWSAVNASFPVLLTALLAMVPLPDVPRRSEKQKLHSHMAEKE